MIVLLITADVVKEMVDILLPIGGVTELLGTVKEILKLYVFTGRLFTLINSERVATELSLEVT